MIKISNIKYPLQKQITKEDLIQIVCDFLKIDKKNILNVTISKKSIDDAAALTMAINDHH